VVCIGIGHVLFYAAMKRIGATIPNLVLLSSPVLVLAISRVVFGETLNCRQGASGVVLLAGAVLAVWSQEHLR